MKKTLSILAAATTFTAAAHAQSPFTYEAGISAHLAKFESITTLNTGVGVGGNLSTYLLRNLAIEGSIDASPNKSGRSGNTLTVQNNRISLIYNAPINREWKLMVGGGETGTHYFGDKTNNEYDSGPHGL